MEIITLIENDKPRGRKDLFAEAGLSLLIRTQKHTILFDTGASGKFASNAKTLGVDLREVDFVVISHAHYDHTGGLERFFQINDTAKVYIKTQAHGTYYYKLLLLKKDIGMDPEILEKYSDRFVFLDEDYMINANINIITSFLSIFKQPADSRHIYKKENNKLMPDDFAHELMLMVTEDRTEFCFTGCSHHGILNMIKTVHEYSSKKLIVIGGFHMVNPLTQGLSEKIRDVIEMASEIYQDLNIEEIITGHCTGNMAYAIMRNLLNDKLKKLETGNSFTF